MNMKIKIITHYNEDRDVEAYEAISIFVNGKLVAEYGSQYDERGLERSEGFVDGAVAAVGLSEIEIERVDVYDY